MYMYMYMYVVVTTMKEWQGKRLGMSVLGWRPFESCAVFSEQTDYNKSGKSAFLASCTYGTVDLYKEV